MLYVATDIYHSYFGLNVLFLKEIPTMSDDSFIIGLIIGVIISGVVFFLVGVDVGVEVGTASTRTEAVEKGHAEYYIKDHSKKWRWKPAATQPTKKE